MCDRDVRAPFDGEPVAQLVRKLYADHVVFHEGDEDFAPGIRLCLAHGHTAGLMVVCCETARGTVVLATRRGASLRQHHPRPSLPDLRRRARLRARARTVLDLAGHSLDHLIPGHDPLVLAVYPLAGDGLEGIAVRLDAGAR